MSGVHALRALEGLALRSVGEGMAHASARGRDGAREIAWVYGGFRLCGAKPEVLGPEGCVLWFSLPRFWALPGFGFRV